MQDNPVIAGTVGTLATLSASAVSFLEQLDLLLRVGCGLIGFVIGVLTLVNIVRGRGPRPNAQINP